jgi:hypothetical protein
MQAACGLTCQIFHMFKSRPCRRLSHAPRGLCVAVIETPHCGLQRAFSAQMELLVVTVVLNVLKYLLIPQAEFEILSGNDFVFDFEAIMLSGGSIFTRED